jgi:putative spermidine/putrescine transport system permease protein
MLLILPSLYLFIGSFQNTEGEWTLRNIADLSQPRIVSSYVLSIEVSIATAVIGGIFGFFIAYAITLAGLPRATRTALITFCGVASNFAGVPLAFAFISTLGRTGFITAILKNTFGFDIYDAGFSLYTFLGLTLTYLYFQFPLMVLIITPALDGMKREWREAAENLGATSFHYWRYIAIPILLPTLLGTTILLFGNAFGAWATAYALTGGSINLITIMIGQQMSGDVLYNPNLGYTLALGMVVIMAISIAAYSWLQGRTERWLR